MNKLIGPIIIFSFVLVFGILLYQFISGTGLYHPARGQAIADIFDSDPVKAKQVLLASCEGLPRSIPKKAHHNICIGPQAGYEITKE